MGNGRIGRPFAIVATLLMLFVAVDPAVTTVALAGFVTPHATNSENNTTNPPPPPEPIAPPAEEPQRSVDPGTVTDAWANTSTEPSEISEEPEVLPHTFGNETAFDTIYGNFVFSNSSPSFVRLLGPGPSPREVAESAFLVLYQGLLLSPANGTLDNVTADELSFHYGLYLGDVLQGTLTVDYAFHRESNKINVSFSQSIGLPDQYQVVWLTFTTFEAIDTVFPEDIQQRFDELAGKGYYGTMFDTLVNVGYTTFPGAIIRETKTAGSPTGSGGATLLLNASDSPDYQSTYAGKFSFAGRSGNAVLIPFALGKLLIDPTLVFWDVASDATAYSGVQRKTFFDGSRYWLFYKGDSSHVYSRSSLDGQTWGPQQDAATAGASFSYGFTVINYGKTVGVLWTDSSDPISIHIRTGLIAEDIILWDDSSSTGRTLYSGCTSSCTSGNIDSPVSATFASRGQEFGMTWKDSHTSQVGFLRFQCTGQGSGFSPCAVSPREAFNGGTDPDMAGGEEYQTAIVVAFNDESGSIARVRIEDTIVSNALMFVRIYGSGDVMCGDINLTPDANTILVKWGSGWWNKFTATASGNKVYVFAYGRLAAPSSITSHVINGDCSSAVPSDITNVDSGNYLSSGTDEHGEIYLFYTKSGRAYHARIIPDSGPNLGLPMSTSVLSSYTPLNLATSAFASRFIPIAFTIAYPGPNNECQTPGKYCLYYSNYPLPIDGEASTTSPWASKTGEPLITDVGGVVGPTSGLLAIGQPLVKGSPAISVVYREPGLFNPDGTKYRPNDDRYQIIPGIYYDLPWVAEYNSWTPTPGILHMTGGLKYQLMLTGSSGTSGTTNYVGWYNITRGIRYTLMYSYDAGNLWHWTLTSSSGGYMLFWSPSGNLSTASLDATAQNYIGYGTVPGTCSANGCSFTGTITDSSGRSISFSSDTGISSYGNGQSILFSKALGSWIASDGLSCSGTGVDSSNSGTLVITDTIGRVTKYWICKWRLSRLESPNGGRVDYSYTTSVQGTDASLVTYVRQGTDAYSAPVTKMDIYNESAAGIKARSQVFSWVFQNGEAVKALVNKTDKSAVVQGSSEYIFNSAAGKASLRTYDSAGQVAYYDMETLNGANLKDLSGNANDGTLAGSGGTSQFGKYGKARGFGGAAWVDAGNSASVQLLSGSFTISAVIQTSSSSTDNEIVAKGGSCAVGGYKLITQSGKLRGTFNNQSAIPYYQVISGRTINDGTWHNVAFVVNGLGTKVTAGYLYIDGALDTAGSAMDTTTWNIVSSSDLGIGYSNPAAGSCPNFFTGNIDEVRMFKRALSPEEIAILYSKNALKKGEQQRWYSINDMPHLTEGFVGDETVASVVTQDGIDDWGNQIYHRDATGNETFASYANTNHQNHFITPSRLIKNTGTQFATEFVDFSDGIFPTGQGTWTVTSTANPATELFTSSFDKVTPSLRIYAPSSGSTVVKHALVVSAPNFIEFRARTVTDVTNRFEIRFGTSSADYAGVRFSGSRTIEACQGAGCASQTWTTCLPAGHSVFNYELNAWYRFTIEVDYSGVNYPWRAFLNGIDLACGSTTLSGNTVTQMSLEAVKGIDSWTGAAIDDIKIYKNLNGVQTGYGALNVGFAGLQLRQSIALIAENGVVIDRAQQTVAGSTLFLSFNSLLSGAYAYYEQGDNGKTVVRIYAEDGTLEYQSPLTRLFVGELYTYTRPTAFADEFVKRTDGALSWPNISTADYGDESNFCTQQGITCAVENVVQSWPSTLWRTAGTDTLSALRGVNVHATPFGYGARTHDFRLTTSLAAPEFFVTFIRIPTGKSPDGIALLVRDETKTAWNQAYWGVQPISSNYNLGVVQYMGPVSELRDQWIQLLVSKDDAGLHWIDGSYNHWNGFGYQLAGGEAEWDVTTTFALASLSLNGLSSISPSGLSASVYYAKNGTLIATGSQSSDTASVALYDRARGISSFPLKVNIKIFDANNEYYDGPARDVWPGDTFRYAGASGFFDPKAGGIVSWPGSTVHSSQVGSKKFASDCQEAVLCYDMETITEMGATPDSGFVNTLMVDLSGTGNLGYEFGTSSYPMLSDPANSAAGLGTSFKPIDTPGIYALDSTSLRLGTGDFTIAAWFRASVLPATNWYYEILGKRVNNNGDYEIRLSNTGGVTKIVATVGDSSGTVSIASNATISANTLYHVAFRRAAGTISLWLNGAIAASTATGSKNTDSSSKLEVGRDPWTIVNFFDGTFDQVIVYKKALSPTQIFAWYQTRAPSAPQIYLQPTSFPAGSGLIARSRTPYEGKYLYAVASYDSKGNVLSVSDVGPNYATGGGNITNYEYSALDGQGYLTKVTRPFIAGDTGSAGRPVYSAYDFQTGMRLGILGTDCRRSRTQYDVIGRSTQSSVYGSPVDVTSGETLHWDMETFDGNYLKDVSCAQSSDSRNGYLGTLTGTTGVPGIEGMARAFNGASDSIKSSTPATTTTGPFTVSAWIKPSNLNQLGMAVYNGIGGTNGYGFGIGNGQAAPGAGSKLTGLVGSTGFDGGYTFVDATSWHLVTMARSGTTITIYVDGKQTATSAITPTTPTGATSAGYDNRASGSKYFAGSVDDVRVFNTALSGNTDIPALWRFTYNLVAQSSAAYDDMTAFAEFAGYPGTSVTLYDGVSTPRSLFFDMQTKKVGMGSTAYFEDLSGNGNHGKTFGQLLAAGRLGSALDFNGISDSITVTSSPSLRSSVAFTVSAWVNPDSLPASGGVGIVGKLDFTQSWRVWLRPDGKIEFDAKSDNVGNLVSTTALTTGGGWYHVAATFDGSTSNLYLNGASQASVSTPDWGNTANLNIGIGKTDSTSFFDGQIDEVQILPRSLTSSDILALYSGYGSSASSLIQFPTGNSGTTSNCAYGGFVDVGDWTNPSNAHTNNNVDATVSIPDYTSIYCNEWNAFGFNLPSGVAITDVMLAVKAKGETIPFITSGYLVVSLQTDNGGVKCLPQTVHVSGTAYVTTQLDFTSCKAWQFGDFNGNAIRVNVGAYNDGAGDGGPFHLDYVTVQVSYVTPGSTFDGTHLSRVYNDGLGRGVRQISMDLYSTRLVSRSTLGWNDQPNIMFTATGVYWTYTYDFLGRTLTAASPGSSALAGTSQSIMTEKARTIESIDAIGRRVYSKTDLLGRTVETSVWNPATSTYGNKTNATYNALSKLTTSKDGSSRMTTLYYNSFGLPRMTAFPDGSTSVTYYDDNLRPFQTVDAMGRVSVQTYDTIGRVVSVTLKPTLGTLCSGAPNPCVVSYGYDPVHNDLLTVDNVTAKITFTYDGVHRVKTEKLDVPSTNPAFTGTVAYGYDGAGKVTDVQYPAGLNSMHAVYGYDSLGRPVQVDYGGSKYAVLTYDTAGRLDNIHYWKGATDTTIQEKYSYDARDRVTQLKVFDGLPTTHMQLDYAYDKASQIKSVIDNLYVSDAGANGVSNPKTVTYEYDGNGRLMKATGPFGTNQTPEYDCYDYDAVGNLAHSRQGAASCPTSGTGYYMYNYAVSPAWNKLDSITNLNSLSFTYNAAGSILTKNENSATTTYTHDFQQQLAKIVSGSSTFTYSYDGFGRRIKTVDPSATSYFMYSNGRMVYSKVGTTESAYVYVGGHLLLRKDGTGATPEARYYHQDIGVGSVRFISYYTTSVQTETKLRYRPFGDQLVLLGAASPGFRFAHQEFDSAVRLYHMGARYYDPLVGRFVQRDPLGSGYSYAYNNPLSYVDPSGRTGVWGNFLNSLQTGEGMLVVGLIQTSMNLALVYSVIGMTAEVLVSGLIVGAIFVAALAIVTGGSATADDYVTAFAFGFVLGTSIGGFYFGVAEPKLGEAAVEKAGLSEAANAERAELQAVRGVPSPTLGTAKGSLPDPIVIRPPDRADFLATRGLTTGEERMLRAGRAVEIQGPQRLLVRQGADLYISESVTEETVVRAREALNRLEVGFRDAMSAREFEIATDIAHAHFDLQARIAGYELALSPLRIQSDGWLVIWLE